ncbi:MAG: CoA-binding protein [Bacteroidota bacterium]
MPIEDDAVIRRILIDAKVIALVGASKKPYRDSYRIGQFLLSKGYTIIPVNPNYVEIEGEKCYPDLRSIGQPIDIIDIFRISDAVGEIVDDAIAIHAKTVWMQLGVINEEAAQKAECEGLSVVMDRCIAIEYTRLMKV